jgi:hypothetical protein
MTRNRKELEGHTKRGRRFIPPLLEIDPLELRAFRRHALPDMLWLVLGVLENGCRNTDLVARTEDGVEVDRRPPPFCRGERWIIGGDD